MELLDGDNQSGLDPTVYTYDARNLMLTESYPNHNPSSSIGDSDYDRRIFTYDAARRNRVVTDQQGDTCTFTWDMANRLLAKDYSGHASGPLSGQSDTDDFEYDDASRMTKATRDRYTASIGDIVCDFVFDDASRLIAESLTTRSETYDVAYDWDAANRRVKITYPDDTVVDRLYTRRNQLETLKYETDTIDSREYDVGMRLDERTLENGRVETRSYFNDNLTEQIATSGVTQFDYTYDANKNKTSELIDSGTGTMSAYGFTTGASGYDDEDRLVNWERDDTNLDQSWTLSLVGDWNSFTENTTTETRTHDEPHQLTAISGGSIPGSLSYDAKGNLAGHSNGHDYAWDFNNMLESAVVGSGEPGIEGTHEYTYDALGRRVSKEVDSTDVTVFVCAGQQVVAEYPGGTAASSPERKFIYATYIDEPTLLVDLTDAGAVSAGTEERFYYHCNDLYSVAALTDSSGNVYERYAYSAYGQILILAPNGTTSRTTSDAGNPYTFTGRRLDDESGMCYYRARYYDTSLGRFISRDPIQYLGGLSLYNYTRNRPLDVLDPMGLRDPDADLPGNGRPHTPDSLREHQRVEESMKWNEHNQRLQRTQTSRSPHSPVGGIEGHLLVGMGLTRVRCTDAHDRCHIMYFLKTCTGGALGGGVSAGFANMQGKNCNPNNYIGWFFEVGGTFGRVAVGADVGLVDYGGNTVAGALPAGFSGINEATAGRGFGAKIKVSLCRYYLVAHYIDGVWQQVFSQNAASEPVTNYEQYPPEKWAAPPSNVDWSDAFGGAASW